MTNIKITQAAREAAASIAEWQASTGWKPCFFVPEFAGKAREGVWDNHPLVEMMQALINQTVEQAMVLVEFEAWGEKQVQASQRDGEDGPSWYNQAIEDAVKAIRTLQGN